MNIAEVGRQYGLSTDTLHYYERIGLIPPVTRNKSGFRDYNKLDCAWVYFIKCMRTAGIPVKVLINYVALFQKGDRTRPIRKKILIEQRELLAKRIAEMQKTLEKLDLKIANYDTTFFEYEKKLAQEEIA
ncbi:transcriptional regulator MerR family [Candidatus Termititenax aidoneus]|uniref:Transcriptional regulator MerR family n=1 Tax=Termititenax aidoneus TaxID=2218524 RepID=A0A388TCX6_TERA1|nr:transcriptional regulator MerR family [Candidatus Termititenax aidoneus]